ncbi:MAG: hypothetical protein ACFE0O_03255 [Opitutales bacterium]
MNLPPDPGKLQSLHSLLSATFGTDPFQAEQIEAAIQHCLNEQERPAEPGDTDLALRPGLDVQQLAKLHALYSKHQADGFAHWDLSQKPYDPLFIRAHLQRILRQLSGHPRATLVVTGLRQALCPAGKYWTRGRRERYREAITYIEDLACRYQTPNSAFNLIIL